jgi:taurine transport system substrate-binding protein
MKGQSLNSIKPQTLNLYPIKGVINMKRFLTSIFVSTVILLSNGIFTVHAAEKIKVNMAWQPGVQLMFFIAKEEKLFEKAGLDPTYLRFNAGPPMFAALRSGDVDFAAMGAPPAVIILSQEPKVKVFFVGSDESHAERLVVRDGANIKTIQDLKGKKIGVWRGTSAEFALNHVLDKAGLKTSDVKILDMDVTALLPAFKKGDVDAIHVWDPWALRLQKIGGKTLVTDADVGVRMPDPWLARTEFLANPEGAKRILKATEMAYKIFKEKPQRAAEILAKTLNTDLDSAKEIIGRIYYPSIDEQHDPYSTLSINPYAVKANKGLADALNQIAAFLASKGKIKNPPDMRERVASEPLDQYIQARNQ